MEWYFKNFTVDEFCCPCCGKVGADSISLFKLVGELQKLRDFIKSPIFVTSGYRCPSYNSRVGGAPESMHLRNLAADISVRGMTSMLLFRYVIASGANFNGIGIGDYYIHFDVGDRPSRTFWVYPGVIKNENDPTIYRK